MRKVFLSIALLITSLTALADEVTSPKGFVGANIGMLNYTEDATIPEIDLDFAYVGLKVGAKFNPYVSAEARVGTTSEDSVTISGVTIDARISNMVGLYLKGHAPINDQFSLYAAVGKTRGKLEAEANGLSASETESSTSYGVGIEIWSTKEPNVGMQVEYMNYFDEDDVNVDGLTLSALLSF